MDDDGSHCLNKEEFTKGMKETGLKLNDDEMGKLFDAFDKDGEGSVNYNEFLLAIRVSSAVLVFHTLIIF